MLSAVLEKQFMRSSIVTEYIVVLYGIDTFWSVAPLYAAMAVHRGTALYYPFI